MRVCILKESLCLGGTERGAANASKALSSTCDVFVVLYDGADVRYEHRGRLIDLKLPPVPCALGKVWNTLRRYRKVRQVLKNEKIDVLYQFTWIDNYLTRLRFPNVVKIISARDCGKMLKGTARYKRALKVSDAMICNSLFIKDLYLSKHPEDKDKVFAMPNVVDAEEVERQGAEEPERRFLDFVASCKETVVAVGRFCREKGFEFLIDAFAAAREKRPGLGLVLVGDGPENFRKRLVARVEKHGLRESVYFAGFQNNPLQYASRCDCYALSSLSEGFPNVLAEAMALGKPVVAANCYSGPAEILRDDADYDAAKDRIVECDYGILTPRITETGNADAIAKFAEALVGLLADPEKKARLGAAAKKRAADFSPEAANRRLVEIFETLLARRNER